MNVSAGDLARVIWTPLNVTPGITDRIVTVIEPAVLGMEFFSVDGHRVIVTECEGLNWVISSKTPLPWMVWKGPNAGKVRFYTRRTIGDDFLRRLGGVHLWDELPREVTA